MSGLLNAGSRRAIWGAAGGLFLAIITNGLIFGLGFGGGGGLVSGPYIDPGPVNRVIFQIVPFVWLGLFAAMGAAAALLRAPSGQLTPASMVVLCLLVNCALYPVYTNGFRSEDAGLAGNYATALLTVLAAALAWPRSRWASVLTVPVAIWVTLASIGLYATQTGRSF